MGIFDKPVSGQDYTLKELIGVPICITGYELREVDTMYGPGVVCDLKLVVNDEEKIASGFAAGIRRQLEDSTPEEFPIWAKIEDKQLRGGKSTLVLVPSDEKEAEQLTLPPATQGDDDIPF